MEIPKFKIRTELPVDIEIAATHFKRDFIVSKEKNVAGFFLCKGGSLLRFIPSDIVNSIFIELHVNIKPNENSAGFKAFGLKPFYNFCNENNVQIISLRNNTIVRPYEGAVMSEFYLFYQSMSGKIRHFISNPKDRKRMLSDSK